MTPTSRVEHALIILGAVCFGGATVTRSIGLAIAGVMLILLSLGVFRIRQELE